MSVSTVLSSGRSNAITVRVTGWHPVETLITEAMERLQVPGVAIGILDEGREYLAGFGVTSVDNPLPVTTATLFQVGSITKTVVGTAVLRLAEMGKLDLETPIRIYLPDLRLADENLAQQVTLRHLLTHTGGGIADSFEDIGEGDDALAQAVTKMDELLSETPLGEVYSYSNSGFTLIGRVIEVVTGMTFERALQECIFDPLKMIHTFFFPSEIMTYRFAVGHEVWDDALLVVRPWSQVRAARPAAGMITCISDLLRYACFHLGNGMTEEGTRLVSERALPLMQTPAYPRNQGWIGLAWEIDEIAGLRVIGHGGITTGQMASLHLIPSRQFAVAILTNGSRGGLLSTEVRTWLYQHSLHIAEEEPSFLAMTQEDLMPYVGLYDSALSQTEVRLSDGGLVIISQFKGGFPRKETPGGPPGPPRRIAFCGRDRVVILDPPWKGSQLTFVRKPDGSIGYLQASRLLRKV